VQQNVQRLTVVPNPGDEILAKSYILMQQKTLRHGDGSEMSVLETVFYRNLPTLTGFLQWWQDDSKTAFSCLEVLDKTDVRIRGIGLINGIEQMAGGRSKAEIGFAFWDCNVFTALQFGRAMIDRTFSMFPIDVLFGTTPTPNIRALTYARRLGFSLHLLPQYVTWRGDLCDVYVSKLSREDWGVGG
jgi:RimJ/RimL family protein N-acetyltransferase